MGETKGVCIFTALPWVVLQGGTDEAAFAISGAGFVMHPQYLLCFPVGFPLSRLLLPHVPMRSSYVLLSQALFSGEPALEQSRSHSCRCSSCGEIPGEAFTVRMALGLRFKSRRAVSGKVQFILQGW